MMQKNMRICMVLFTFVLLLGFSGSAFAGPAITSIAPNSAGANSGVVAVTDLAGADFVDGVTVALVKDSTTPGQDPIIMLPVEGSSTLVASSTKIVGLLFFGGAEAGAYDVEVTNPDGESATLVGGFTVTE